MPSWANDAGGADRAETEPEHGGADTGVPVARSVAAGDRELLTARAELVTVLNYGARRSAEAVRQVAAAHGFACEEHTDDLWRLRYGSSMPVARLTRTRYRRDRFELFILPAAGQGPSSPA